MLCPVSGYKESVRDYSLIPQKEGSLSCLVRTQVSMGTEEEI